MSGTSYSEKCPNCGKQAEAYSDWKPFNYTELSCLNCGFYATTKTGYMTLEELNNSRIEEGKKPFKRKPQQTFTF